MSRRSAFLLAVAVGLGAVVAYLLLGRRPAVIAPAPVVAPWAPDPGPAPVTAPVTAPVAAPVVAPVAAAAPPVAVPPQPDGEQPLPTWVRFAIVGAALVAFFAVSLIATRNV
ncbi:MAG: hypothetical protein JWN77_912 [Frankiales bacterium]|jgi:hypothetical protein|nr:hypothetical protein [Frankiales bacterium]